jgi:hypothetical protein
MLENLLNKHKGSHHALQKYQFSPFKYTVTKSPGIGHMFYSVVLHSNLFFLKVLSHQIKNYPGKFMTVATFLLVSNSARRTQKITIRRECDAS